MKNSLEKAAFIPYTFVLMNWAVVSGLVQFLRGFRGVWESVAAKDIHARAH